MSPEQARGKTADTRADIWAFGCVLYEMLASRRAFGGDTSQETLAAVLVREPDWGALPPETPAGLVELLRQCVEKDPARRLRDIAAVRLEIDEGISASRTTVVTRIRPLRLAVAGLTAVAAAAAIWAWSRPAVPAPPLPAVRRLQRARSGTRCRDGM